MRCHDCHAPVHLQDGVPRPTVVYCDACIELAVQTADETMERELAILQLSESQHRQESHQYADQFATRLVSAQSANSARQDHDLVALLDAGYAELVAELMEATDPDRLAEASPVARERIERAAESYRASVLSQAHRGPLRRDAGDVAFIELEIKKLMDSDESLSYADAAEQVSVIFPEWFGR